MSKRSGKHGRRLGALAIGLTLMGLLEGLKPSPGYSAETIHLTLGPLDFPVSVRSLEQFAKDGTIAQDLAFYTKRLNPETREQVRQGLRRRFEFSSVQVARLTYTQLGESLLKRLGLVIEPIPDLNGFHAIRSALILAAADPQEGFTVLNVLRRFPTQAIWVRGETLLQLGREVSVLPKYRDAIVAAVTQQEATEAVGDRSVPFAQLADLRQRGPYRVTRKTLTFPVDALRQTPQGLALSYNLPVDFYLPDRPSQPAPSQPAPIVVMTHGFGSTRETYHYVAEHLASHGIVVAAPEHIGSNLSYRNLLFQGLVAVDISPLEFLSRPLDLSYTIDAIEHLVKTDPDWAQRINLNQIGVFGNSFGGTTALSLAGATIDQARLQQECTPEKHILNFSALLQCRASSLPPQEYDFRDRRVKAVFAAYPLTSLVFGPEGLGQITIPTLIMAGSRDVFTPVITEQIYPYLWLRSPQKHLALMVNGTHFSTATDEINAKLPSFLRSPRPDLGREYINALSVAFFYSYLADRVEYKPYLTAAYGQAIGQEPLDLRLVRSLSAQQIEAAYGKKPPLSIEPTAIAAMPARSQAVLEEIQRTGTLKVALRIDAAPFGSVDSHGLVGYCSDLADALATALSRQLKRSLNVKKIPVTLENRFAIVQTKAAHLECGPDTIRRGVPGISFSNPFFVSGTQFLVKAGSTFNPAAIAEGEIGVLKNSLTEQFLQRQYPDARSRSFAGQTGRSQAVQAVSTGTIAAFATDGVLAIGEVRRQGRSLSEFALVPKQPLTCDFYGVVLPSNDRLWQETVNVFLRDTSARQVRQNWLLNAIPQTLQTVDRCLNN